MNNHKVNGNTTIMVEPKLENATKVQDHWEYKDTKIATFDFPLIEYVFVAGVCVAKIDYILGADILLRYPVCRGNRALLRRTYSVSLETTGGKIGYVI